MNDGPQVNWLVKPSSIKILWRVGLITLAAMIFFACICIALGIAPGAFYELLPFSANYQPYTVPHVINQLQLLLFAGLSFFLALPLMKRTLTISLD